MATRPSDPDVMIRRVRYGNRLEAFLAEPARAGQHPTMILLHERYGLAQHTLDLAAKFARYGFLCLAPDLFSRHPERDRLLAGEIHAPLPDPQVTEDLDASIAYLRSSEPTALADKVAIMGVCQTGRHPIAVAAHRDYVSACIVFYGGTYNPSDWNASEHQPEDMATLLSRLPCPVLGVFGEGDFLIAVDDVRRWRDTLEANRKSYQIKLFAGMPHGWLNDTMPGRYRAREAEEAWQLMIEFVRRVNDGGYPADRVRWHFESDIAVDYDPSKNVRLA
jgi:carboxymethylenebutenolidase